MCLYFREIIRTATTSTAPTMTTGQSQVAVVAEVFAAVAVVAGFPASVCAKGVLKKSFAAVVNLSNQFTMCLSLRGADG